MKTPGSRKTPPAPWVVYILECADGTLYTGITTDLQRRTGQHQDGTGARYTKGRGPQRVVFAETHLSKNSALKREAEIKSFSRNKKLNLIKNQEMRASGHMKSRPRSRS